MSESHDTLRCPNCQSLMQAGFLPVSKGMHFIRGDGRAASHFAEDIPGTHAIMRVNRLLAWRCKSCQFIVFRYGRDSAKTVERLLEDDAISAAELAAQMQALEDEVDPRA